MRTGALSIIVGGLLAGVAAQTVDYAPDVEPLLRARCYGCHGAAQQMKGLRLDRRESVLGAGRMLITRVTGDKGAPFMPPVGEHLKPAEVEVLRRFIEQTRHWAFQPIVNPAPPAVRDSSWVRNPIDAFILARLEHESLKPSPETGRVTLLRRVSLDLTGLPPTPQEVAEFLADTRADAYERLVDRLLASPHYGERWARPWLDRTHYADSDGYEKDWFRPWAWRYRDWVIDSFNRDVSFDQFTLEQLAGDSLPDKAGERQIAAGFLRMTLTNREGGVDNAQFRFENTVDRANTTATVWLGLTAGCAQCHDHKFDPIKQKDYYSLFAYFDNVEEADVQAPLAGERERFAPKRDEYRKKRAETLSAYSVPALQEAWEKDMLDAAAHPGRRTDWDLAWDCLLKLTEGGWDGEKLIRTHAAARTERESDTLTDHFVRNYHFAVGDKRWKELKFPELDKKLAALKTEFPQLSEAMVVRDSRHPVPSHLRVRGDYKTLGETVTPAAPHFLPQAHGTRRLDLALWIISPENPLAARVAVNWIWQELFGTGIVKSADDFGTRGDPPSHPELLDWLATEYQTSGWSTKRLIRTIVLSSTYRQSASVRAELQTVDPGNRLLARQSRLRLSAELIRDSALAASGLLNDAVGGPSIRPPQPAGVAAMGYGRNDSSWVVSEGRERYRRGLYIQYQRSTPYPLLVNFDAPRTEVAACTRERSNTPLQALNLLNDPVFVESANALAALVKPGDFNGLFQRVLGRPANVHELARLNAFYNQQHDWPAVASVLFNLDEFITRE